MFQYHFFLPNAVLILGHSVSMDTEYQSDPHVNFLDQLLWENKHCILALQLTQNMVQQIVLQCAASPWHFEMFFLLIIVNFTAKY